MSVSLLTNPHTYFAIPGTDAAASGYKLFTYAAGTSNKVATYTDAAGAVAHTNPIIIGVDGTPPNPIHLTDGTSYDLVLAPSTDTDPPASGVTIGESVESTNTISNLLADTASDANGDEKIGVKITAANASATTQHNINELRKVLVGANGDYPLTVAGLNNAIDDHTGNGGYILVNGALTVDSLVTVKKNVIVDFQNFKATQGANTDLFNVQESGQLRNLRLDITGTFTSQGIVYTPTTNVRAAYFIPWLDSVAVEGDTGATGGTAIHYDATTYYIEETQANNISVYFCNKAISMTAAGVEFCNGNVINGLSVHDAVYSIWEDDTKTVDGNCYHNVIIENNSNNSELYLNNYATVNGVIWDRSVVTFKGSYNKVISSTALVNDNLTDEGIGNQIIGRDVEYYYNKRSLQQYSDRRNNLSALRGKGEYVEDFMTGAISASSSVAEVGSGSQAFQAANYGGANKKWAGMRYVMTTGANTSDSEDLKWADSGLRTGHDPVYLSTAYMSETADTTYQFGFYVDANNYIIYEADVDAGTITPKVKSGGTETVGTAVSVTFNQIFWMRIVVNNTSCVFTFGTYGASSNNVGDGIYNLGNEETITTNIPTGSVLQTRNYVRTDTTSAKQLSMLFLQVNWSYGYLVP